jgi:hypothetical protein
MSQLAMAQSRPTALLRQWDQLDEACRGGHGDDPATDLACKERARVQVQLYQTHWCYGEPEQYGYEEQWHPCHGIKAEREAKEAAENLARANYVPQYETLPGYEWHQIAHDTHGFGSYTTLEHFAWPFPPGYYVAPMQHESHPAIEKGALFIIPDNSFDPKEIEMTVEFLGNIHLTIPVAAIDPKVLDCKIDKSDEAERLFHQALVRCEQSDRSE